MSINTTFYLYIQVFGILSKWELLTCICNFMVFSLMHVPWFAFFVLVAWHCNYLKHKVLPISFPQLILLDLSVHHYQVESIHLLSGSQKWFLDPWNNQNCGSKFDVKVLVWIINCTKNINCTYFECTFNYFKFTILFQDEHINWSTILGVNSKVQIIWIRATR